MAYSNNSIPVSIVGAVVVLVFIIGALVVYNAVNSRTAGEKMNPQAGTTVPAPAPANPSTTGSGAH